MKNPKITVIVATHKDYPMPSDPMYLPLLVGATKNHTKTIKTKDNTGKNISKKNPNFCELTGFYWAWKNLDVDYLGLVHYRRHFLGKNGKKSLENVLTEAEASEIFQKTDIILPKKRNYVVETLYDHYAHTMHAEPLDLAGKIIAEKYPKYLPAFKKLHTRRSAHMFNMCIMKKSILDDYCAWLFDILFELEKRVDAEKYDAFHARFYGRVSELLLDVYLETNSLDCIEVPTFNVEGENWLKKGSHFLAAKFLGRKYEKSF